MSTLKSLWICRVKVFVFVSSFETGGGLWIAFHCDGPAKVWRLLEDSVGKIKKWKKGRGRGGMGAGVGVMNILCTAHKNPNGISGLFFFFFFSFSFRVDTFLLFYSSIIYLLSIRIYSIVSSIFMYTSLCLRFSFHAFKYSTRLDAPQSRHLLYTFCFFSDFYSSYSQVWFYLFILFIFCLFFCLDGHTINAR